MAKRGTLDHEKTLALAAELGIDPCFALGLLEAFWQWVARHRATGDVTGANPKHVAVGMHYSGDAQLFWESLLRVGWLDELTDGRTIVHDWSEHADNAVHQALKRKGATFADGHKPFTRNKGLVVTCHDTVMTKRDAVTTVSRLPEASSQIPEASSQSERDAIAAPDEPAAPVPLWQQHAAQVRAGQRPSASEQQRLLREAQATSEEPKPAPLPEQRAAAPQVTASEPEPLPGEDHAARRKNAVAVFRRLEGAFAAYYHNPPMGKLAEDLITCLEFHVAAGRAPTAADVAEAIKRQLKDKPNPPRRFADELTSHLGTLLVKRQEEGQKAAAKPAAKPVEFERTWLDDLRDGVEAPKVTISAEDQQRRREIALRAMREGAAEYLAAKAAGTKLA